MIARTIDILAALDPDSTLPKIPHDTLRRHKEFEPLHDASKARFMAKYTQTGFGWHVALQYANRGLEFPMRLTGRDQWVYRAYLLRLNPRKYLDDNIMEAYHLAKFVNGAPNLKQHLKAMLLSFNDTDNAYQHLQKVSRKTGVSLETLDAFEILFFNVIDRRGDYAYLVQEVYPETRIPEMDENYMRNSTHEDLIKRVAYNHRDIDLTAYMAGFGDHTYMKKLAASDDREAELTRFLMGNGLMLAHTSLLNQRTIGMNRATSLLAAARQSGQGVEEPTLTGIVPLYSEAFQQALSANRATVMDQMQQDGGFVDV